MLFQIISNAKSGALEQTDVAKMEFRCPEIDTLAHIPPANRSRNPKDARTSLKV